MLLLLNCRNIENITKAKSLTINSSALRLAVFCLSFGTGFALILLNCGPTKTLICDSLLPAEKVKFLGRSSSKIKENNGAI